MTPMLYQAYQNHVDFTAPMRNGAGTALSLLKTVPAGVSDHGMRRWAAALELMSRATLDL